MSRKHYSEDEVIRVLSKKNDIRILKVNKEIRILSDKIVTSNGISTRNPNKRFDLGNGSWGKIDYLTKFHGYDIWKVSKF
ncbi:hypothetical protein [uncultured Dysgonomonas sp.]|uniref:Uncharacterized protein n=1 Tax=uncultured Dysgonomonas sp. TaxID=206096 RepID=A0A212IXR6_9BACT|nr:hypothetical protein [uncultured Dysgonomonas sp.]SBV91735.1 hypothetical protein KL86DYS1_10417 [uncultured Dysgonomonas sp.]